MHEWGSHLAWGLEALGLSLSLNAQNKLLDYLVLLNEWNRVFNLTAIEPGKQQVTYHILDSLSIVPHLTGPRVLDVGTGAGLPGVPLACANPDLQFTLLDSQGKRIRFLHHVCQQLDINNIELVHARIEDYQPAILFDAVVSRAFAQLSVFLTKTQHCVKPQGDYWAMKGHISPSEKDEAIPGFDCCRTIELSLPGEQVTRHLLCCRAQ